MLSPTADIISSDRWRRAMSAFLLTQRLVPFLAKAQIIVSLFLAFNLHDVVYTSLMMHEYVYILKAIPRGSTGLARI